MYLDEPPAGRLVCVVERFRMRLRGPGVGAGQRSSAGVAHGGAADVRGGADGARAAAMRGAGGGGDRGAAVVRPDQRVTTRDAGLELRVLEQREGAQGAGGAAQETGGGSGRGLRGDAAGGDRLPGLARGVGGREHVFGG